MRTPNLNRDAIASGGLALLVPNVAALMCVLLVAIWIHIRLVEEPYLLHASRRPRRRRASSSKPSTGPQSAVYTFSSRGWPASERTNPARDAQRAAGTRASALTRRVVACSASAPLLCLDGAKTCFCLLAGSLELAHARRAGGPLSIGLGGLVQVVALAGVLSLCSQIVRVPGGHAAGAVTACGGRSAVRRGVSRGRVGVRSRCWAVCS